MLGNRIRARRLVLPVALATTAIAIGAGVSQASLSRSQHPGGGLAVPAHARLTVRSSEYGKAIFDTRARVLYVFSADRTSKSNCYGVCAKAWPPMLTKGAPTAGPGVNAKLLGTTKRRDGSLQVTYNHHPLYYYSADKVGKIMCQHANMHGGLWFIIKPNGQPNKAPGKMHM
jgi:predicted lipoprotein with Yx(FWY)xxD motif